MMTIDFPKVYFSTKDGWKFTAVIDGRLIERSITPYAALGLGESIFAAQKQAARPQELNDWDRRVAC
jgi:hypothetical protein